MDAASGGAADDVDLEVQRLLSVYDLVKDQESMRYVVRFSLEFISMWIVNYFVLWEEISSWHGRPGLSFNLFSDYMKHKSWTIDFELDFTCHIG